LMMASIFFMRASGRAVGWTEHAPRGRFKGGPATRALHCGE